MNGCESYRDSCKVVCAFSSEMSTVVEDVALRSLGELVSRSVAGRIDARLVDSAPSSCRLVVCRVRDGELHLLSDRRRGQVSSSLTPQRRWPYREASVWDT